MPELTQGLFTPAGVSPSIVKRLNAESVKALTGAESRDKLLVYGAEVVASSPEQFEAAVRTEMTRLGKVIKEARITSEQN